MHLKKSFLILIAAVIYLMSLIQPALSQACKCSYPTPPDIKKCKVTSSNGVIIRDKPCTSGVPIGSLKRGDVFSPNLDCLGQCVDRNRIWLRVYAKGPRLGYLWAGATNYTLIGPC
jgi:hypothetical protein